MKFLGHRMVVYVPLRLKDDKGVRTAAEELTRAAGGSSAVVGVGQWANPEGVLVEEPVVVATVLYEGKNYHLVQNALDNLVAAMGRAGELEVLVDHTPAKAVLV